jgi:hypothetical protein
MDRFRLAARAYLIYGVIYWLGGFYLATQGVGIRGSRVMQSGVVWIVLGLVFVGAIPYLLAGRRAWFERWILSRRDFARVLTAFMALRAWHVLRVALRPETASIAAPWGGEITFRAGAIVFLIVTVAALLLIGRAAWAKEAQ